MKTPIVIDASALLGAWLPGEATASIAALLFDIREERIELHSPDLLSAEILNGLYRATLPVGGKPARIIMADAHEAWSVFERLQVQLHDSRALGPRALELAGSLARTAIYDCLYVALAETLQAKMITADQRLLNAAGGQLPFLIPLERYGL